MSETNDTSRLLAAAPLHAAWPEHEDEAPAGLPLLGTVFWAARTRPEEGV